MKQKNDDENLQNQSKDEPSLLKKLVNLFFVFFKIGAVTFGGGMGMLPILERDLADKRGWTTREQLLDYYAIGQSTPGIVAVNVATFIGYNRCGILGGCIATAGVVFPSIIIITIIALGLQNFMDIVWVQKAMKGVNVAVAAMLTKSLCTFASRSVKNILGFVLFALAFSCIYFFKINTVFVIVGSALIGILSSGLRGKLFAKKSSDKEAEVNSTDSVISDERLDEEKFEEKKLDGDK